MTIDLHGQIEQEAIGSILGALWTFVNNKDLNYLEIITGKGQVLRDLAIELIEEEELKWNFKNNNQGVIIVNK